MAEKNFNAILKILNFSRLDLYVGKRLLITGIL